MKADISKTHQAVVDASIIAAQLFPNEKIAKPSPDITQPIAPELLKFEVTNAIKTGVARKRLSFSKSQKLLDKFINLPIKYYPTNFNQTLKLAIKYNLSVYDASYLSLSHHLKIPLLTLDKKLSRLISK